MLSYSEFIEETSSHGTGTQTHDVNAVHRMFPDILSKKKKVKLTWKQRRQHRQQKERAGATTIQRKTASVQLREARNYSVMNRFGGLRYKNTKKADRVASVRITKPKVIQHTGNVPRENIHISRRDMKRMNASTGYKTPKPIQKFNQFTGGIRRVVNNPVATIRRSIKGGFSNFVQGSKDHYKHYQGEQQKEQIRQQKERDQQERDRQKEQRDQEKQQQKEERDREKQQQKEEKRQEREREKRQSGGPGGQGGQGGPFPPPPPPP
jgi:hypothetical protein